MSVSVCVSNHDGFIYEMKSQRKKLLGYRIAQCSTAQRYTRQHQNVEWSRVRTSPHTEAQYITLYKTITKPSLPQYTILYIISCLLSLPTHLFLTPSRLVTSTSSLKRFSNNFWVDSDRFLISSTTSLACWSPWRWNISISSFKNTASAIQCIGRKEKRIKESNK